MATKESVSPQCGDDQDELRRFREQLYDCLCGWGDTLFELVDGLSSPIPVDSLAHVSLAGCVRRGHGSGYAALHHGRIDAGMLRSVLVEHCPPEWGSDFAVDVSGWPRREATCSAQRSYVYHASQRSGAAPVVAGWPYLWIAGINQRPDSWTAPVDAYRLAAGENPNTAAVARITLLLAALAARPGAPEPGAPEPAAVPPAPVAPLFVFDAGFDPVQLSVGLQDTGAQVLVRIRNDRVFAGRWYPPPGRRPGAPRRHGARFRCKNPATWPKPYAHCTEQDQRYGRVQVTAWGWLHPYQHTYKDPDGRMRIVEGVVIRVQVAHLPGRHGEGTHVLWLWWAGADPWSIDLHRIWRAYLHRFRPGAHLPVRQAGPGLDHPEDPHPRAGRPVDLAGAGRVDPATAGPPPSR